ncbi:MAG: hypothetical protein ABL907_21645 [Hyphomicrobium sp.]
MTALTDLALTEGALAASGATSRQSAHSAKVAGVLFAAIVPALFWVTLIAITANAFALTIAPVALAVTGSAIALFLAAVCAPLMLRAS